MKKLLFFASILSALCFAVQASAAHELEGTWVHGSETIVIDGSGSFATNVTTPAGFAQEFPEPLAWYSTSPTTGYFVTYGYFSYTHGDFPYQVACHHPTKVTAYIDQLHDTLVVNFLCPAQVWAVWQPEGGYCQDSGVLRNQRTFTKQQ